VAQANSPVSVKELADKTGTVERLVSEWLANQVTSGYIEYDPSSRKYRLPPEHALALADENSPVYLQGIFKAHHYNSFPSFFILLEQTSG